MDMWERSIVEWGREEYWHCKIQDYKKKHPGCDEAIDAAVANLRRSHVLSFAPDGSFGITNHGIKVMGWSGPF